MRVNFEVCTKCIEKRGWLWSDVPLREQLAKNICPVMHWQASIEKDEDKRRELVEKFACQHELELLVAEGMSTWPKAIS